MYEKLQGFIRTIKSKRETSDIDLSLSADEFQPISESSRLSLDESTIASGRMLLPPVSPRSPCVKDDAKEAFFIDRMLVFYCDNL